MFLCFDDVIVVVIVIVTCWILSLSHLLLFSVSLEEEDKYASYKQEKRRRTAQELAALQLPPRTLGKPHTIT